MPHEQIVEYLNDSFEVTAVAHHWRNAAGQIGMTIRPTDVLDQEADAVADWRSGELTTCHPLLVWFAQTRDPRPQTMARVPTGLVNKRKRTLVEQPLRRLGLEQQLALNYQLDGIMHRTYVLGRSVRDFSDADLEVANYLQWGLLALDFQVRLLREACPTIQEQAALSAYNLTARESAVLTLLARGDSTRTASRKLGCSPRTAEKHLERAYRKLGVRDRVNAVLLVRTASTPPPARPDVRTPVGLA